MNFIFADSTWRMAAKVKYDETDNNRQKAETAKKQLMHKDALKI